MSENDLYGNSHATNGWAFQKAMIDAVAKVTHIAPADASGEIIGSPVVAPGVIEYALGPLGLCAGITDARYKTITDGLPRQRTRDTATVQ